MHNLRDVLMERECLRALYALVSRHQLKRSSWLELRIDEDLDFFKVRPGTTRYDRPNAMRSDINLANGVCA